MPLGKKYNLCNYI